MQTPPAPQQWDAAVPIALQFISLGVHRGDPSTPGLCGPGRCLAASPGPVRGGGGPTAPPITSAYPEVYYYTNVNSRTGIWGAAARS